MFGFHFTKRAEKRVPMAVAVRIAGHALQPGVESTFTSDVSSQGARIYSTRRWKAEERLFLSTFTGFRSVARVAWCAPSSESGAGFAVGLQLLETAGNWVVGKPGENFKSKAS